jgi:hypothetical protein
VSAKKKKGNKRKHPSASKFPTREEVERLSPTPTPEEQVAWMEQLVGRLKAEGRPAKDVARYEAELTWLRNWKAEGFPIPPVYDPSPNLSIPALLGNDELTNRAWDAGLRTSLIDMDASGPRIKVRVRAAFMAELERLMLWLPNATARRTQRRRFEAYLEDHRIPPNKAQEAKGELLRRVVTDVIRRSGKPWREGEATPALSTHIGFERWVWEKALSTVREFLGTFDPRRDEVTKIDKQTGALLYREVGEVDADVESIAVEIEEDFVPDSRWMPFLDAWCLCDEKARIVWLADWPGIFRNVRALAVLSVERAKFVDLTAQEQAILEQDLRGSTDSQLANLFRWTIKTAAAQVPKVRQRCVDKIAAATGSDRKQLGEWLRDISRGKAPR